MTYRCDDCGAKLHTRHRLKAAAVGGDERCHACRRNDIQHRYPRSALVDLTKTDSSRVSLPRKQR